MSDILNRRGILRGLLTLPLIGGGVTLIGAPTASAEPLSLDLLNSYHAWLHYEHRLLSAEACRRFGGQVWHHAVDSDNAGGRFHRPEYNTQGIEHATKRAALVLSSIGCDWRT